MVDFGDIYKFDKEENFDEFVATLNLSEEVKAGFKRAPTGETLLKNDDGTFTHIDYYPDREVKITFTPGVEVEVPFGQRSVNMLFTFEGKLMKQKMEILDGEYVFIKRLVTETDGGAVLKAIFLYSTIYSDVTATRYFKI